MNAPVIKFRCPYCAGKVAVDTDYYRDLVGKVVSCPHCEKAMIIPATVDTARMRTEGSHGLDRTQEIQMPPALQRTMRQAPSESRHCPFCGVEVGRRDQVCITCGNRIPLPEPPPGFSQIRA